MEILQIILIILSIIYIVISIGSLHRLSKVSTSQSAIKISVAFYSGMFIASASRAITIFLISINIIPKTGSNEDNTFLKLFYYLMVVIPDMVNVCVYLFLIWYFFANFILSHINLANDLRLFMKNDSPVIQIKTYTLLYIMIPAYALSFGLFCLLALFEVIGENTLFIINSYFNLITPFFFLGYYIFLLIKFSGRPYFNENMKMQVRRILVIVIIWSFARLITGILGISIDRNLFDSLINQYDKYAKDVIYSMILFVYFLVSEYIPDFFALDYSFMTTLILKDQSVQNEEIILDVEAPANRYRHLSVTSTDDLQENLVQPNKFNQIKRNKNDFIISSNDFNLLESIYTRSNGLGNIYKASYKSNVVTVRQLKFDRLSRYDLEGLSNDMEELIKLNNPHICQINGLCVESLPNVYIIWPYFNNGSLHDLLHIQKAQLDLSKRMKIAKQIAIGMDYLHDNSIFHFHLSSRNVLVQDDLTPLICDYGFHYFKEISSIFLKYKNKNSYTSPELLKDNRSIGNITGTDENFKKCDVYSFGMLLWELYTCTLPFNVKLNTVIDLVVKDNYRPEITKDFNVEIANLIRLCWDLDPKKRPDFKIILQTINKINFN